MNASRPEKTEKTVAQELAEWHNSSGLDKNMQQLADTNVPGIVSVQSRGMS